MREEVYSAEGIDSIVNLFSYNVIKFPSKSFGFIFSSISKKEISDCSGLSCGIFNQITENNFSFGKCSELEKSSSLVIRTLCSDFENAANLQLASPFGFEIISNPFFLRNFSILNFTFSSLRNLTERDAELDIIFTPHEISSILKSCFNVFFSQRRIIFDNPFNRYPSLKHLKNLPDHNSGSFKSRSSPADFTISDNIIIDVDSHGINNSRDYLKLSEWVKVSELEEGMDIAVSDGDGIKFEKIINIETHLPQHVYDLMIENTHNFIANDIVAHNTYIGNSSLFVNSTSGNVGIGTTAPSQKIHVVGDGSYSATFMNGNVGIGTTSPVAKLDVNGSVNIYLG